MDTPPQARWVARLLMVAHYGLILVVLGLHLRFCMSDPRLPRDPGLYYQAVPRLAQAASLSELLKVEGLFEVGGWYSLLILLVSALGEGPKGVEVLGGVWLLLVGLMAGKLATRLGGKAMVASALVLSAPGVTLGARSGWIHLPETALLLMVLVLGESPLLAGVAGALALALRPSALPWLGLCLLWLIQQRRSVGTTPWWRFYGGMLLLWGVGLLAVLPVLPMYLGAKLAARARYLATLPELGGQITEVLGSLGVGICLAGVGVLLVRDRLRYWLLWPGVALGLGLLTGAGLDNFTPALAVVLVAVSAGAATVRFGSVLIGGLALLGLGLSAKSQFVQDPVTDARNWNVPCWDCIDPEIPRWMEAVCMPEPFSCTLAVDQGLFQPYAEDPGRYPLFFTTARRVEIVAAHEPPSSRLPSALALYQCEGDAERAWRQRYPRSLEQTRRWLNQGFLPVWERPINAQCKFVLLTPGGKLVNPVSGPTHHENPPR